MAEQPTQRPRIQMMGLWKTQGRNGEYLRGKLGDMMVWVFPNDRKKDSKEPDYRVFVSEDRPPIKAAAIKWTSVTPHSQQAVEDPELAGREDFIGGDSGDDVPF